MKLDSLEAALEKWTETHLELDSELRLLDANDRALDMMGVSTDSWRGARIQEALPRVVNSTFEEALLDSRDHGRSQWFQEDSLLVTGLATQTFIWPHAGSIHVFSKKIDPDGSAPLTESKYKKLIEAMPCGVYFCDQDGVITFFNSRAAQLWGREPRIGDKDEVFCGAFRLYQSDGKPLPKSETPMAKAIKNGLVFRGIEVEIEREDGSRVTVSVNVDPLYDEAGNRLGAVNVFEDISQRKAIQDELMRSMDRFHLLADNMAQLAWTCDKLCDVTWYNKRWFEYTGMTFEEMRGWGWKRVHHPDHIERVVEKIQECAKNETPWEDTFPLRGADGEFRWFLSRAIPIRDSKGDIVRWFGTNTDITARLEAEQKLAELNETLEERVASRTEAVEEMADQLRALAAELMRVEQRERRRLATFLHDHIQQLLVAAKLQLGRSAINDSGKPDSPIERATSHIDEAIKASRSLTIELSPPILYESGLGGGLSWLVNHIQEQQGLTAELTVSGDIEPQLEEVRPLLFESVKELLFNSAKHSGQDRASVTASRGEDNRVEIVVADEGCGFDLTEMEKNAASTGFGLFSIQQRLAHFGGELTIDTEPGNGTRIMVAGPPEELLEQGLALSSKEVHGEVEEGRFAVNGMGKIRVILVDDHQIIRQGLAGMLEVEEDMEVIGQAGNAVEGIDLVRELRPDVVIMDVNMPDMNGIEATRIISREDNPPKVIGLSMYCEEDIDIAMREAGAVDYITKDGAVNELVRTIRSCFDNTSVSSDFPD